MSHHGCTGFQYFLAFGMLVTGSINTLSTKLADVTDSVNSIGEKKVFDHPFVQALGMFIGEFMCLLALFALRWFARRSDEPKKRLDGLTPSKSFRPYHFILPACCDMTATSLMYIGLTMTYASVFQMLRGAVVIFTGLLSVTFLRRRLQLFHWFGMLLVLAGLTLVGVASVLTDDHSKNAPNPILGDILVIAAQVVQSIQMVVEEKYVHGGNVPPLLAVGCEGLFGMIGMSIALSVFYFIPGDKPGDRFANPVDAWVQIKNSWVVIVACIGNVLSIAFFNFFGISVTKEMSASTRMVLDSLRTVVIWAVSLAVRWESFQILQVVGFVVLLYGMAVYNKLIVLRWWNCCVPSAEHEPLIERMSDEGEEVRNVVGGDGTEPLLTSGSKDHGDPLVSGEGAVQQRKRLSTSANHPVGSASSIGSADVVYV